MEHAEKDYSIMGFLDFIQQEPFPERNRVTKFSCVFRPSEAIVLSQLEELVEDCRKRDVNHIDGKYWVCNSYADWKTFYFSGMSEQTIRRSLISLEKKEIVISRNYNNKKSDKTKWYTIDNSKLFIALFQGWINYKNKLLEGEQDENIGE